MSKYRLLAVLLTCQPLVFRPVVAQQTTGGLIAYHCSVQRLDRRTATVTASFEAARRSSGSIATVGLWRNQTVSGVLLDRQPAGINPNTAEGALKVAIPAGSGHSHEVSYRVTSSANELTRIPLPIPSEAPPAGQQIVDIDVMLPQGETAFGDQFPAFIWSAPGTGRAELGVVPSFLLVQSKADSTIALTDNLFSFSAVSEALMFGCIVAGSAFWWLRQLSPKRRSSEV